MAFFLTPRFAPAYSCNPFNNSCAPAYSRPVYRRPQPAFPSFVPFLAQVDELLSELDREAHREAQRRAHLARQQRKRAFRARFNVEENQEGWEVQAEVPGFEQDNIQIEVTDEKTLKLVGNTEWKVERPQAEAAPAAEEAVAEPEAEKAVEDDAEMDGVTITEADAVPSPAGSDTESHKSYQATVEDDFEDLGAETSSTVSAASEPEAPKEPKGKEKVVDEPTVAQPEAPAQQQEEAEEPFQGAFERTFKFPVRIDTANVRAAFKDGVLRINVPRAPVHQVRQITIQ